MIRLEVRRLSSGSFEVRIPPLAGQPEVFVQVSDKRAAITTAQREALRLIIDSTDPLCPEVLNLFDVRDLTPTPPLPEDALP